MDELQDKNTNLWCRISVHQLLWNQAEPVNTLSPFYIEASSNRGIVWSNQSILLMFWHFSSCKFWEASWTWLYNHPLKFISTIFMLVNRSHSTNKSHYNRNYLKKSISQDVTIGLAISFLGPIPKLHAVPMPIPMCCSRQMQSFPEIPKMAAYKRWWQNMPHKPYANRMAHLNKTEC